MTTSHHSALERALAIRLNLQISLSAFPVVEEWMDIHLTRWIESIPLPPEMPRGHAAHFAVKLATDLSRLSWRAYGDPAGFVPKMAKYFGDNRMTPQDTALLDQMGNTLEPQLVGTWVQAEKDRVSDGWQFCDEQPFSAIEPFFGEHEAKASLVAFLAGAGMERVARFAQSVGEEASSVIELPVPGVAIDDQLGVVARAFETLAGEALPGYVTDAMLAAPAPGFQVGVRIQGGRIVGVAALSPGLGNDVITQMCTAAGIALDDKHARLQGAFGADGVDRVEYSRPAAGVAGEPRVDLHIVPTGTQRTRPVQMN